MNTFDRKLIIQLRCIRRYAHALHLDIDRAAQRWVDTGCAAKWAAEFK